MYSISILISLMVFMSKIDEPVLLLITLFMTLIVAIAGTTVLLSSRRYLYIETNDYMYENAIKLVEQAQKD